MDGAAIEGRPILTLEQAVYWTRDLSLGSQKSYQFANPKVDFSFSIFQTYKTKCSAVLHYTIAIVI